MRSSLHRSTFAALFLLASTAALSGCGSKATSSSGTRGQTGTHFDVNVSRPRGGTIVSVHSTGVPDGKINCGTAATACGPAQYDWSATAYLVAVPDAGYKFVTWAADCVGTEPCTLDTRAWGADKWVAAGFELESSFPGTGFLVALQRPQGGTIRSGDGRLLCGTDGTRCGPVLYEWTASTTLTATADAGLVFQGWTGSCSERGLAETCDLTSAAPADKTVGAAFGQMGASGGVVENPEVPGLVVTVPPGALDSATPIQVSVAGTFEPPPPAVEVLSPVYKFEPEGTVFADAVDVEIPEPAGQAGKKLGVYWKKRSGPGYDYIGGVREGGKIKAKVFHFSDGFVAEEPLTRTIQGTRFLSYVGANGKIDNVPDAENLLDVVQALVPNPGGGYTAYPGAPGLADANGDGILEADGTFAIPDVPHGTALVQIGVRYVETAENTIAVTRLFYGRGDMLAIPYTAPATLLPVTYALTNLEPWQPGDELHLFSPDADTLSFDTSPPGVLEGSTSVSGWQDLFTRPRYALHEIDGTGHGDVTFVTQMSGRTSPTGLRYLALSRVLRTASLDLAPVPTGTDPSLFPALAGAMGVPPLDQSLSVDWDVGAFDDALLAAAPSSMPSGPPTVQVLGEPSSGMYGVTPRVDKRLFLKMQLPWGTRNVSTGAMPFGGTPFQDRWALYWMASVSRYVQRSPPPPPGYPAVTFGFSILSQTLKPVASPATLLAPEVTPATGITLDGVPLTTPLPTGVSLVPTIAWTPPATGADVYQVFIYRLVRNPDGTILPRAAVVDTTRTSFEVPPGVLEAGQPYAVNIRAQRRGVDVTRPTRMELPVAFATNVSEWFVPGVP